MFIKPNFKRYIAGVDDAIIAAGITAAGAIGGATVSGIASGKMNKRAERFNREEAAAQRAFSEQQVEKQNAWNYEMWQKVNEYNSPEAQLQRMRDAGLNPLYYGLDGSSANGLESAQPLGYERAQAPNYNNPVADAIQGGSQIANLTKDIQLKDAQIDKLKEDANSVKLDNEFKDKTMNARVQAEELANNLTKEQIGKIDDERKNIRQEYQKLIEETKNENLKGLLIQAQTNLNDMQTKEIAELLPQKKLLMEAQTTAQKAAAAASFAKAAIDRGLLKAGYIDKYIESMEADIKAKNNSADAQRAMAELNNFKASVRTGNVFTIDEDDSKVTKLLSTFFNNIFYDLSVVGEAITGPLANIIK